MVLRTEFPSSSELRDGYVHVWKAALDYPDVALYRTRFWTPLAVDEQVRARRFRFEQDRHRFIAGRFFLRSLLAKYLNLNPASLTFSYSAHGKPELQVARQANLYFNLSHAEGLALLAFGRCNVGVDVEFQQRKLDVEGLALRYFFPTETKHILQSSDPQHQRQCFLRYWTAKEAYLKATGEGIAALEQVEILDGLGQAPQVLDHRLSMSTERYGLCPLSVPIGYFATLAVVHPMPTHLEMYEMEHFL